MTSCYNTDTQTLTEMPFYGVLQTIVLAMDKHL